MDFPVLENVPEGMRPQARQRLVLKRDLGGIFPGAHRIFVGLPGDIEVVSENGNNDHHGQFTAIVRTNSGQHQKFQAATADDLLQQAQLTQDGK